MLPVEDDGTVVVSEPLSSRDLDSLSVVVEVVRDGDTAWVSTVDFSTVDGSAKAGVDYAAVNGTLVFQPGNTSVLISVPILANHQLRRDTRFTLQLFLPDPSTTSDPTTIGPASTVTVVIRDYDLEGPYFPALPQLDNTVGGVRQYTAGVYYDLPLTCITVSSHPFSETKMISV